MTLKHIEKVVGEFYLKYGDNYIRRDIGEAIIEAKKSAYLAGQDSVRKCVPEERELLDKSNPDNYEECYVIAGFNDCRRQTLSSISQLQDKIKE